jgi:superfamily II DNA or RNA helicase
MLVNYLLSTYYKSYQAAPVINILILVAKRVHKQTWKEEIEKWGGINHPNPNIKINICMECYESLKNHCRERWEICLMDECHHVGSEVRLDLLRTMTFGYIIGLSATIPRKLKQFFKYRYHSEVVSCDIIEAIEDDVLPEPEILLFPLILDNRNYTETWEMHPKAPGPIIHAEYKDIKKYKYKNIHTIISCTQKQKVIEFDSDIAQLKKKTIETRSKGLEMVWQHMAGERLKYLADIKIPIIKDILRKLSSHRTITFCKTIQQAEQVSKNFIHSKNPKSDKAYQDFNSKKINHISTVNILNENANLVDCQYGIFGNLSSSEIVQVQRCGRLLRHKKPIIIVPYFDGTRESEIVQQMFENYNRDYIRVIHSIQEI